MGIRVPSRPRARCIDLIEVMTGIKSNKRLVGGKQCNSGVLSNNTSLVFVGKQNNSGVLSNSTSLIFSSSSSRNNINKGNQGKHFSNQQHQSPFLLSYPPNTTADETFGLYWDDTLEEDPIPATLRGVSSSHSVSTISPNSSCNSTPLNEYFSDRGMDEEEKNVVFVFENKTAPVSCRSFESMINTRQTQVCVSIEGYRIIQDDTGELAEFKVRILVNSREYVAWKNFSHFQELAFALQEFSSVEVISTSWTSIFRPAAPLSRLLRRSEASIDLTESLMAWERVLEGRFWGWSLSRNLSVEKLMQEAQNLETFLRNVLFEIPTPDIIVEFISTL